jgi:hypothetical protein
MNVGKLKGPEKVLQIAGKHKFQEHESRDLLYIITMLLMYFILLGEAASLR